MDLQNLQKLLQTLKEIGLNANEANTYIGLLSVGPNPASVIAKKAGINRCTCYTILERMMKKGFVNSVIRENITYYSAVEPKYILQQLKHSRYELEDRISNLGNCIAGFELLKKEYSGKPKVAFFEGVAGVQNVMEDTLNSKGLIRAYASLSELTNLLPDYWPNYYRRRAARGIFVRSIYPADEISLTHKLRDNEELRESRLVPKEFDFHLDFLIYDDKVAITSLTERFGVLIESKEMAESHKRIFDFIWEGTRQYDAVITGMMKGANINAEKAAEKTPVKRTA
jgi:sugar-specific transcriptional regulator TrmB